MRTELAAAFATVKVPPFNTSGIVAANEAAAASTVGLASEERLLQTAFGRSATILSAVTAETNALVAVQAKKVVSDNAVGVSALKAAAAETRKAEALAKARKATEATVARGAAATGLEQLGIRGATLAASTPFLLGAAAVTTIGLAARAASNFQSQLLILKGTVGATDEQMKSLTTTARALARDVSLPGVSARDSVEGLTALVQAGFSVEESQKAIRGALLLSKSAGIDTAQAVEATVKVLDSFGLGADQATHATDVLTNAAKSAEGTVLDFSAALQQVGPIARHAGLSLEDTTALLTLFAKNGLAGAAGAAALRTALLRLSSPTTQASSLIKQFGIQLRDTQGNLRPDVFAQFGKATEGLGKQTRDAILAVVFGNRALRAAQIGSAQGTAGLGASQQQIAQTGSASQILQERVKGLGGQVDLLKKSATSLGIDLGNSLLPALTGLVRSFRGVSIAVDGFVKTIGPVLKPVLGAALVPLLGAVVAIKAFGYASTAAAAISKLFARSLVTLGLSEASAAAGAEALAVGEVAAGTAGAGAAGGVAAFELSLSAFLPQLVLVAAAIGGLEIALHFLGGGESDTKKATDELTAALERLGAARTGRNLIAARQDAEALAQNFKDAAAAAASAVVTPAVRPGFTGPSLTGAAKEAVEVAKLNEQVDKFAQTFHATAAKLRAEGDTVGAHSADLLADFGKLIHNVPNQKVIKLAVENKSASLSLQQFLAQVEKLGGASAAAARAAGRQLEENIAIGLARTGLKDIALALQGKLPVEKPAKSIVAQLQAELALLAKPGATPLPSIIGDISNEIQKIKDLPVGPATDALKAKVAAGLGGAFAQFIPSLDLKGKAGVAARSAAEALITGLKAIGPAGIPALRAIGAELMQALAGGITDSQKQALDAANQAVADAITAGKQQVDQAVVSAKTNLGSIASTLAGSVGQVLDARATAAIASLDKSDLALHIKALQGELDKTNISGQRAQLQFAVLSATDDASRRSAIFAATQFDKQTTLKSEQDKLQARKDAITQTAALQKEAITKNLAAYADEFAKGQITLKQFSGLVLGTLHKQIPDFKIVGTLLGVGFASAFDAQIKGLLDQAGALVGFTSRVPGGTTQIGVTKPGEALAASSRAIAKAIQDRENTQKQIRDAQVKSHEQLRLILAFLRNHAPKPSTPHNQIPPGSKKLPTVTDPRKPVKT